MPPRIALLRGVNVGGHQPLPMSELREVLTALGHTGVRTYLQSGNAVFTSGAQDCAALARELAEAIAGRCGITTSVVVLDAAEFEQVAAANPYRAEPDPRQVHLVLWPGEPDPGLADRVTAALRKAAAAGNKDEAQLVGRGLYLHTRNGLGRSRLAALLSRGPGGATGTARNWATVTNLLSLCRGAAEG